MTGPSTQRHRLALLALLVGAHPRAQSRGRLAAYLWPERPEEPSRSLLSQAVHALRRELGHDVIVSAGDDLRIEPGPIRCDVLDFRSALAAGDHEGAVDHYAGPFLDGFVLPGAVDFEQWADRERERLRRDCCGALRALAEGARDDPAGSVRWWRQLAALEPYSASVTLGLMEALEMSGNRADALAQAGRHSALLREAFDAEPNPDVAAFAERLRTSPVAHVEPPGRPGGSGVAGDRGAPGLPPESARAEGEAPGPVPRVRSLWRAVGTALAILILGYGAWLASAAIDSDSEKIGWLAVLPCEGLTDEAGDYLLLNTHVDLISRIGRIPGLNVTGRQSALAHRGAGKTVPEIARDLNVDGVVGCQVARAGDSVRVRAQLVDAFPRERQIWEGEFTEEFGGQPALLGDIALAIADRIRTALTPEERARIAAARSVDRQAYESYLRGNFQLYEIARVRLAIPYFEEAIQREPEWAPPYVGLARVYVQLGAWWGAMPADSAARLADRAIRRAIALDESSGEAHMVLGAARYLLDWDWAGAERAFRRGMELGGVTSFARLEFMNFLTAVGRPGEAIVIGEETVRADPLYPIVHNELATALWFAGRHDEALERFRVSLELDRNSRQTHELLLQLHLVMGNVDQALAEADRLEVLAPYSALRAVALAAGGRNAEARAILDSGRESAGWLAAIHAALDEPNEALDMLDRAYEQHDAVLVFLREYFLYDPLRDDPRFQALVRKMDFPAPGRLRG